MRTVHERTEDEEVWGLFVARGMHVQLSMDLRSIYAKVEMSHGTKTFIRRAIMRAIC